MKYTKHWKWLLALAFTSALLYGNGVGVNYFGADFAVVNSPQPAAPAYFFTHPSPAKEDYRPLQGSFLRFVQINFGVSTIPIHLVQLFLHILLTCLIYVAMLSFGFGRRAAVFGSFLMALSQNNVMPVLSNDTISQVGGTLFGCLAIFLYARSIMSDGESSNRAKASGTYICGAASFALALLSKETSLGYSGIILLIASLIALKVRDDARRTTIVLLSTLPFIMLTTGYLLLHSHIVTLQPKWGGNDVTSFNLRLNVVKNLGLLFASQINVVSSPVIAQMLFNHSTMFLAAVGALDIAVLALFIYGLVRSGRPVFVLTLAAMCVMGFVPALLLNHVSELYAYNSMPFFCLLAGLSFDRLFALCAAGASRRNVLAGLTCLFVLVQAGSVEHKVSLMKTRGEEATDLLNKIAPIAAGVPRNGTLLLVSSDSAECRYSVFLLHGFDNLQSGFMRINQLADRTDFTVGTATISELSRMPQNEGVIAVTLDGANLKRVR